MMALLSRLITIALSLVRPACRNGPAACHRANATAVQAGGLDQLLAPITLYPDPLLSEVLIASTYPLGYPGLRFAMEFLNVC